jgi:hypothetical protein
MPCLFGTGNSGGPALRGDVVVGVAFQNLPHADNIGYIIPLPVVRRFLRCAWQTQDVLQKFLVPCRPILWVCGPGITLQTSFILLSGLHGISAYSSAAVCCKFHSCYSAGMSIASPAIPAVTPQVPELHAELSCLCSSKVWLLWPLDTEPGLAPSTFETNPDCCLDFNPMSVCQRPNS